MQRRALLRAGAALVGSTAVVGAGSAARQDADYEPLGRLPLHDATDMVVDDGVAYVAANDRTATVDLSDPADPTVLAEQGAFLSEQRDGPLWMIWEVRVDDDRLLAVGPANERRGLVNGVVLLDVSDPGDPRVLTEQVTQFPIHNAAFEDGIVYLTGNELAGNPLVTYATAGGQFEELGRWSLFDHDEAWRDVDSSIRLLHDVHVRGDLAYLLYWDAGTVILDVSDPAAPEFVTRIGPHELSELADLDRRAISDEQLTPPGNHHNAVVDEDGDLLAIGKESWATNGSDGDRTGGPSGVDLYDVSDPSSPRKLATIEPPSSYDSTPGGWYTTAHNCDLAGDRLYTSWYFGGVKLHDVSDPSEPEELAWWRDPSQAAFFTARVVDAGEFFVATSAALQGSEGALYTFPDRPGEQPNPRSLQDPPGSAEDGGTADNGADSENDTTARERDNSTDDGAANGTNATGDDGADDDPVPGFGVVSGVAGLAGGVWAVTRRRNRKQRGD